jgi:hypothetical protein
MRIIVRSFIALFVATASFAYCSLPQMTVVVSDSSGRAAYKGATDANGAFSTASLKPGSYVVQFNSKRSADVKGKNYALVVSAGHKKVTADSVEGDKFAAGGVAMRIEVGGSLSISGQVVDAATVKVDKDGKKMVWIPRKLGSNLPAHWAAEDSPEAKEAMTQSSYSTKNLQDKQNQGSTP